MGSIDIVITTYRNTEKLKVCLQTIIERTKYVNYKIYLLANDPNDEVKKIIHDAMYIDNIMFNDKIIPIFNDNNSGSFSSNNNDTAKEGSGDYILFLNDDVFPLRDDWLYNMSSVLDDNEKIGAVGALLLYPDQKTIQHCGVFFSHKTNNLPYHMFYRQPINSVSGFISQYRYYQAVTGACLLVRRKDFETIGGFSENYFYMYEDIDLCLNIKNKLSKHIIYCPNSILVHNEGISKDGKQNPKFKENIEIFKKQCTGLYFNDLEFYLSNSNHMIYKRTSKQIPVEEEIMEE